MAIQSMESKFDVSNILQQDDGSLVVWKFLYGESWAEYVQHGDDIDGLIGYIRGGLPKAGVDAFVEKTNISREQLSHVLHLSVRQLNRYSPVDRLAPEQSNFLYELARIYTRTVDVLGDQRTAEHWLSREQLALGNQIPLDLLDTTEGLRLVDYLLTRIEHGLFS